MSTDDILLPTTLVRRGLTETTTDSLLYWLQRIVDEPTLRLDGVEHWSSMLRPRWPRLPVRLSSLQNAGITAITDLILKISDWGYIHLPWIVRIFRECDETERYERLMSRLHSMLEDAHDEYECEHVASAMRQLDSRHYTHLVPPPERLLPGIATDAPSFERCSLIARVLNFAAESGRGFDEPPPKFNFKFKHREWKALWSWVTDYLGGVPPFDDLRCLASIVKSMHIIHRQMVEAAADVQPSPSEMPLLVQLRWGKGRNGCGGEPYETALALVQHHCGLEVRALNLNPYKAATAAFELLEEISPEQHERERWLLAQVLLRAYKSLKAELRDVDEWVDRLFLHVVQGDASGSVIAQIIALETIANISSTVIVNRFVSVINDPTHTFAAVRILRAISECILERREHRLCSNIRDVVLAAIRRLSRDTFRKDGCAAAKEVLAVYSGRGKEV